MPTRSTHRPTGRPRLPPERRRRPSLTLCMTAEEIKIVRHRAALARLPTATYVRASALRPTSPPHTVPVLNIRSYGQLGRLANNLNQLTKLAHQGRILPALLPNLADLLAEVRRLRRQLVGLHPDPDADFESDTDAGADADSDPDAGPNAADASTAAGREPEPASESDPTPNPDPDGSSDTDASADTDPSAADPSTAAGREAEPPSESPSDLTSNPNPTPGHPSDVPAEPRE